LSFYCRNYQVNHFSFHNHHGFVLRMKLDHLNKESGHV
jgi:hypothetical protein